MIGMAKSPRTWKTRALVLCAWGAMLLVAGDQIRQSHGSVRFLPLFQIAVAVMCILYEIKQLIEEPH